MYPSRKNKNKRRHSLLTDNDFSPTLLLAKWISIPGMRNKTLCSLIVSLAAMTLHCSEGITEDYKATTPPSQNQMIKITDKGLEPAAIEMRKEDRVVFFFNDSKESLVTLDLSFGAHATHCASENLRISEDGTVRSIKPIAPKDFATTCFHDPGSYPFSVSGVKGASNGFKGTIVVK